MNDESSPSRALISHLAVRVLATLAVVGGLGPASGCSGEAEPLLAASEDAIENTPSCPGMMPPAPLCMESWCNLADLAWDQRPLRQGTPCNGNGNCDGQGQCVPFVPPPPSPSSPPMNPPVVRPFRIKQLGDRCVSVGPPARWASRPLVVTASCRDSVEQRILIREVDATHDVELRTEGNNHCLGIRGAAVVPGNPLEVQPCDGSRTQRFAVDGDAILVGLQMEGAVTRDFVIEPNQGRTAAGTPLVVGVRDLTDAEFFTFTAVDGSRGRPTSGFVTIEDGRVLNALLADAKWGWGTVVEFPDASAIQLLGHGLQIRAGVTLRSERKGQNAGSELTHANTNGESAFLIRSPHVRLTGFRLKGAAESQAGAQVNGIQVEAGPNSRVLLDHLEVTNWSGSAIDVRGSHPEETTCSTDGEERAVDLRTESNFVHDNIGYGIVVGNGAFGVSQGNVLYRNRHDFAADPWARTGYNAYDNLVLGPLGAGHSVDMHGSGDPGHWQGGRAGDAFDVAYNTILQVRDDKPVLALRGTPCRFMKFRSNVVREDRVRAILDRNEVPGRTVISNNLFDADVSMTDLAVGNFDGDRNHDVFIGTGAGWFYSPAGRREWRFLSRNVERASELRFGDFDGDGRTDVVAKHGTSVDVSWAGESPWQRLTTTALGIEDLAVGDFNGDGIADLFASNGVDWLTAASGVGGWTYFATSGKRVRDLRFGDFDNDRRTDVLGVEGGMWKLVNAAGGEWTPWNSQLSEPMETMVIADFDSDSIPDVAGTVGGQWRFSKSGAGPWVTLRNSDVPMHRIPIGRFDDNVAFSALVYIQDYFDIFITGRGNGSRWSRQIMR